MAGTNNAVTKALEMLDLLGGADQGLRLKAIAQQLGLPESTAHRLLASLVESGFVEQRDEHGEYSLGWKIVVLANAMGRDSRLVQMVRPYLEELVRQLGHTANLAVLSNLEAMYLDCQTPRRSMALYVASGLTLPVYATSLGKSMLTFQDEDVRDTLIDRLTFTPLTPNTVRSRSELMAALEEIRRHGYAIDRGELRPDVCCVAAPLLDSRQRAIAAISVTAPEADLPSDWDTTYPLIVAATARAASEQLFGAPALDAI